MFLKYYFHRCKDKQIEFVDGDIGIGRFPGWHRCKGFTKLRDDNGNEIINEKGKPKYERCGLMVKLNQTTESLPYCSDPNCTGAFQKGKKFPSKLARLGSCRFVLKDI